MTSPAAFKIDARWPKSASNGERDVAHMSIWAEGEALTRLVDFSAKEEREYFRSSAVSLAFWFADNWWRLRYEALRDNRFPDANWRLHHELTSASGGTRWPPLMFNSTGERVLIAPIFGRPVQEGSLRYIAPEVHSVSGAQFEAGVDDFFSLVLRACANAQDGDALAALVGDLKAERAAPDIASWRRLEARLGYNPDQLPQSLSDRFEQLEVTVGEEGVNEAAAAVPGARSAETLDRALDATRTSGIVVELEVAKAISRSRIKTGAAAPWQLGEETAHQLRQQQAIPDGPLRSKALSELFAATTAALREPPATARQLAYAARLKDRGSKHKIALQSSAMHDRRFELACVLGDAIWAASDFGVVSKAKTDRQKFQRAFAQNLLVPYADLKAHLPNGEPTQDDIDRCARTFHVNPRAIRRLLILKNVIRQETLEEQLEAA